MVKEEGLEPIEGCLLALRKFHRIRNRYKAAYLRWRDNRWRNIAGIEPMIECLEETRNNCNIASLSGGCAGLVGGILTGAGLITIPFTVGATAPLIIAGASLAVSGGATGFGAGIADLKLSNSKCQEAQVLIDRDVQLTMDLLILEKEYAQYLKVVETTLLELQTKQPEDYDRLNRYLNTASTISSNLALVAMVARSIYLARLGQLSLTTACVVNRVNPLSLLGVARVADSVDDVVEAGSQVGVAAVRGAKVGIAAAAVLCVVGLALDITSIVYTSRQIHVYRKKKQASRSTSSTGEQESDKAIRSASTSTASLNSNDNQHNNNKIYLKSVDKELHSGYDLCSLVTSPSGGVSQLKKCPPGGELWADVVSSDGSIWKEECIAEGEEAEPKRKPSLSRSSSGSWEKIDYTPDMLIEVDEECLFQNRQFSLEFDPDLLDSISVTSAGTSDTQQLIVKNMEGNEDGSIPQKIVRKIKHSFTKEYISDRAEKLKRYTERLFREAVLMERNPTIADLLNDCKCQQCISVGGTSSVYCCHEKRFYWNCVYDQDQTDTQTDTSNTPSLCVSQHPRFHQLYLTETSLQTEISRVQELGADASKLPRYRLLRYCAYRLIVRSCWGNNDISIRIPGCIRRAVINAFQPNVIDVWACKEGLYIKDLWEIKDSVTCSVM